tara:strand:+ start:285 stop:530 length:246 start_codon:yes stop_codon:yes gene_type:complete
MNPVDTYPKMVGGVSANIKIPAMLKKTGVVIWNIGLIIRQARTIRFLERLNIAYTGGNLRPTLTDKALFNLAYKFVGNICC